MEKVIIIRYGEIFLKGKNRSFFESLLIKNIKDSLDRIIKDRYTFIRSQSRYAIAGYPDSEEGELIDALKKVFGIHSLSVAYMVDARYSDGFMEIKQAIATLASDAEAECALKSAKFRVTVTRADKRIPMRSYEIAAELGGVVLERTRFKVDLTNYDYDFHADIRENGKAYVYVGEIKGAGGLPVGCSSNGLLLLSGGIDSPVAAYMMAKRGMKLTALHFASPPYTSERAKQKVAELRDIVQEYTTPMKLYVATFTEIQLEIHKRCPEEFMITIMRRFMMRVATKLCKKLGISAIITGESLGQVASQTVESMTSTESCAGYPIFRPLIAFDKEETVDIAKRIGTYDVSIEPYEDCCTVFLPKNPVIHPKLEKVEEIECALDVDALVERAFEGLQII